MSAPGRHAGAQPSSRGERLHTPAALNNREPILKVLEQLVVPDQSVLEIGSGTGVHVAFFAARLPGVRWRPSDPDGAMRASVAAWCEDLGATVDAPLDLDVRGHGWWEAVAQQVDAVLSINMLHVAPDDAFAGLAGGAARLMAPGGLLALYGPFRFNGQCCGTGNERFDAMLRGQNPAWGLRDVNDIAAQGAAAGFAMERVVDMPAANHMLILRRR
jgi:cyclopropane fatty-acyl-phospholipid synthase-like methyltransferase